MKIGRRLQYLNHLIGCYRIARSHLYILIPDSIHFMRAVVISLTLELGVTIYFFPEASIQSVSLPLLNQIWGDTPVDWSHGDPSERLLPLGHVETRH